METTSEAAFPGYVVTSNKTGAGFYIFVLAYAGFAFILIIPLVTWSRTYEKKRLLDSDQVDPENQAEDEQASPNIVNNVGTQQHREVAQHVSANKNAASSLSGSQTQATTAKGHSKPIKAASVSGGGRSGLGSLLRELDKVAAAEYPDHDPDFQSRIAGSAIPPTGRPGASKAPTAHSSGLPSAATTSRLRVAPSSKRLSSLVLDVSGRRWKHRRPIGRVDVIQNAINSESGSMSQKSTPVASGKKRTAKGISDVASSVLEEQSQEIHPTFFNRATALHRQRLHRGRTGSHSVASERSILSSIVDDISPNDAADANDPGRGNIFQHREGRSMLQQESLEIDSGLKLGCVSSFIERLLDLAAPGEEMRRVVLSSFPLAVGAMSEALSRLITATFISQYLGSESMVAYLLVGLFVRLTSEELSGAIIDALSSFIQASLLSGEGDVTYLAGQYVQLAVVLQLLLGTPLLLVWALTMEPVVFWLVQSSSIAFIAEDYARVVVINYLIQAVSRTFTVVFHICGHEHFESVIDFSTSTMQLIVVACVVSLVDKANLTTVGYIQVLIGIAGAVAKVTFPVMRGWMKPFRKGMFENFALVQVSIARPLPLL
jgi:hypothetical protein